MDTDIAKAAAAAAKKTAMNKRKKENARKNKADAEEKRKMEEEAVKLENKQASVKKDGMALNSTRPSLFDPELLKALEMNKDSFGISSAQI